jgi:hypothetical protein
MRIANALLAAVALISFAVTSGASIVDSVVVIEQTDGYEITVPISQLVMTIPREGLSRSDGPRKDATASRRYFLLEDRTQRLSVSGWFEPDRDFPGTAPYWKLLLSAWSSKGVPEPANPLFKKIGGWDAVTYQMPLPPGSQSNIQAHWLEAGTWIHLHLSLAAEGSETVNQQRLELLLGRIQVRRK